jgi:predicted metal-dependent hydrolase
MGWYRSRAEAVLFERLASLAHRLPWLKASPPASLRAMKVQWGSCSPAGRVLLNPELIRAPGECIDYVLLHELCHLKEHNHGPRFHRLLDRHMPEWRRIKTRLDATAEALLAQ